MSKPAVNKPCSKFTPNFAQGVLNRVTEAAAMAPVAAIPRVGVGLFTAAATINTIHKTVDVPNWMCHGCGHPQKHH